MPIGRVARGGVQAHELVDVPLPARAEPQHDDAEQRARRGQHLPGAAAEAGRHAALGQLRDEPRDRDTHAVADRGGDAGDQALQHPAPRQQGRRQRGAAEQDGAEGAAPGVARQPPPPPAWTRRSSPARRHSGRRRGDVRAAPGGPRRRFRRHARLRSSGRPTVGGAGGHRTPTGRMNRAGRRGATIRPWSARQRSGRRSRERPADDEQRAGRGPGRRRGHGPRHVRAVALPAHAPSTRAW